MRRRRLAVAALTLLVGLHGLAPRAQASEAVIVAYLEGSPIAPTSVSEFHCHDFEFPVIQCYSSEAKLEAAMSDVVAGRFSASADALSLLAVNYVHIFEHSSYAGGSLALSQDYTSLGSIGWNNRISSYKAVNSETGSFYTETFYSGAIDTFCCNQNVSSLSSTFDNQISSVRRT